MKNSVISLDEIRDMELNRLQEDLIEYATFHHEEMLTNVMEDLLTDEFFMEDEEEELMLHYLTLWIIFSVQYDGEQTIVKEFIALKIRENKLRSSALTQLEKWKEITPSFNLVKKVVDPFHIEIEDALTGKRRNVKLNEEDEEIEEGILLLGFLLPYGSYDVYYTMYLDFDKKNGQSMIDVIKTAFEESESENGEIFMRASFPHLFLSIVNGQIGEGPDLDELKWEKPIYEEVVQLYKAFIKEEELPEPFYELGVMLWNIFCMKEGPTIRKRENYVAALVYFIDKKLPFLDIYTKAELANQFNISKGSLDSGYRKLEAGLAVEIAEMYDYLIHEGFTDYDENAEFDIDLDNIFAEEDKSK